MKIGVGYYPEYQDKSLWKNDVKLMKEAGINIVRMAEFAWGRLDSAPPQWLFEKYPEVIQADRNKNRVPTGICGHRCLNSPVYRNLAGKIITKMVERYKDNKCVTGYQIDNELEANHCFCPVCEDKFRHWIMDKYGTTDNLNKAYGNNVWSGEFSSFIQASLIKLIDKDTLVTTNCWLCENMPDFYNLNENCGNKSIINPLEIRKYSISKGFIIYKNF